MFAASFPVMGREPTGARRRNKLGAALGLIGLLLLLVANLGPSPAAGATSCPSFRVLHNDRIGPASLPAGNYDVVVAPSSGLSCASASKLFTRFLEDYDGILPRPWKVVSQGAGKASFTQAGKPGFSVMHTSGGGGGNTPLGALCKGTFTVNTGAKVGPLTFPKGRYLLYIPPQSAISCRRSSVLFTKFLATPNSRLPAPWLVRAQTATFYKPSNPTRSAFRVEPFAGAGPT